MCADRASPTDGALAAIRATFFQECDEQLASLEGALLALDDGRQDAELVNAAFRAVHSIKGGASALEMAALAGFAHQFETPLAAARSGGLVLDKDTLRALLRAFDALADMVRACREGREPKHVAQIEAELSALCRPPAADDDDPFAGFVPKPVDWADFGAPAAGWNVRFRPYAELYAKANEPLRLLRDLAQLAEGAAISLDDSAVPTLDALDPEESYLSWTVSLGAPIEEARIREVFEFVEGDCDLDICASESAAAVAAPEAALAAPVAAAGEERQAGAALASKHNIRVDVERLDDLANLVGELVINHALLSQRVAAAANSAVGAALEELDRLTRDLQECVMAVRAQPLRFVFQRMARVVRDAETATGKRARLIVEGEGTEVDRTLIEALVDPLTHMIRNAIDHGLESEAIRVARGKPAEGVVRVSARHRGGRVVIEVSDDGAGIDRERVRELAIERGIIAADAVLTDVDIDHLIFSPGFSTAPAVSAISGRGVGMDVVRCSVQSLGGRMSVDSVPGQGARFTLSLPLTLAVLDGMIVKLGEQIFVAPLATVIETIPLQAGQLRRVGADADVLVLRGACVPTIDLGAALGLRGSMAQRFALVVEDDVGRRAALLVSDVLGQRQVVIKSLEANYRNVAGVAAATILGEGQVALIIDINAILASVRAGDGRALAIAAA